MKAESDIEDTDASDDSEPEQQADQTDKVLRSTSRSKRELRDGGECGCSKRIPPPGKITSRPKWLPPGARVNFKNVSPDNPVFGTRMRLFCRTNYHLTIHPDKKIRGINEDGNPYAVVEFKSVYIGEVTIRGVESNLYLAMNQKGRLYGEADGNSEAAVFIEYVFGQYNLYLSRKWAHMGWYVGIKKSGKPKPGHQTRYGQKAIQFLPLRGR